MRRKGKERKGREFRRTRRRSKYLPDKKISAATVIGVSVVVRPAFFSLPSFLFLSPLFTVLTPSFVRSFLFQTIVLYPVPNIVTCTMRIWLREIGFALAYGALMLKTWR